MSKLALHRQEMEASLNLVAGSVDDFPLQDAALASWLNLVAEGLTDLSNAALSPYGMHQSDFRALMHLFGHAGSPVFPNDLSICLTQTPANITRIANLLVKRGLVSRTHSRADRRRVELRITPAGRLFVIDMLPKFFPRLRAAFSCLDPADKQVLERLLLQLVRSMDTMIEP